MSHTIEHSTFSAPVVRGVSNFFSSIWAGLMALAEANARTKEIEYLQSLSDEALVAKGIRRDRIVQYAFRGRLFL